MVVFSRILGTVGSNLLRTRVYQNVVSNAQKRCMSDHERTMHIKPSDWQWDKFKDFLQLYTMVGAIPLGIIIFCLYVFVGPATLEEIPEGYIPKEYEYYRNPVTRLFVKYCYPSHQEDYEKYMHYLYVEGECIKLRKLENKIRDLMKERMDYKAFYYQPYIQRKYILQQKEAIDDNRTSKAGN